MRKFSRVTAALLSMLFMLFSLIGCNAVGDKATSMSIIYGTTTVLSLLLLIGYCCMIRREDLWFLLLFTSVLIVNIGYFSLSISKTLEEALLANRISYLGSVFLPMSMLMIIMNVTKLKITKWVPGLLLGIGIAVFFVAASPGYLDIYYKEVFIETVNGVTVLDKVYGSWHCLYFFYLIFYFAAMVTVIVYATVKKKIESNVHAIILAAAVLVNIGVWLLEQLVKIDFEFLSVSYIISEIFLLCLYLMLQENERKLFSANKRQNIAKNDKRIDLVVTEPNKSLTKKRVVEPVQIAENRNLVPSHATDEQCEYFVAGLLELTRTERMIYDFYIEGKSTKEIMAELNIKENTLKYHNKNLYGKLGVSSRKQLTEIARVLESEKV